jgi:oligosaccharide repeat unit polymerase
MQFAAFGLIAIALVAVVQVIGWFKRRMYAQAIIGTVYVAIYPLDLIYIGVQRHIYLIPSAGVQGATDDAITLASVMAAATWGLYFVLVETTQNWGKGSARRFTPRRRRARFALAFVIFALFALVTYQAISRAGIAYTLVARQRVFGAGLLQLLGYFVLPPLAVASTVLVTRMRGIRRWLAACMSLMAIGLTALTGSRSALFLTVVIPILAFAWRAVQRTRLSVARDAARLILIGALVLVPLVGGTLYLTTIRDAQTTTSILGGIDVSQSDVLVALIDSGMPHVHGASYLAALVSFVPRAMFAVKPDTGGIDVSEILSPARYALTGAQVTPGVLGEGYLNFGVYGFVPAALLMWLLVQLCQRYLASEGDVPWVLGVVLVARGLNLLRGDLTNVLVPVVLTTLLWVLIFGIERQEKAVLRRGAVDAKHAVAGRAIPIRASGLNAPRDRTPRRPIRR